MNDFFHLKSIKMWSALGGLIVLLTGAGFLRALDVTEGVLRLPDTEQTIRDLQELHRLDSLKFEQFRRDFLDSCNDIRNAN